MSLTDVVIRNAKPGGKTLRLFDGGGLYLEVSTNGGKWWRLKYRFAGKEKRLSLGIYPEVSLKDARDRRDALRKHLADGIDPSENRKAMKSAAADKAANSFEVVRGMRLVPVTRDTLLQLAAMALLPIAPLLLTMISLEELLGQLVRVVI